ncbi:MAG: hypothetical protein M3R36_00695 [Bacteroidota bacterium]|nr:hypothetical protein [Bacteroidota bacterium]
MNNYKAVQMLKGMTKKELSRFEKFLLSPFYNNDEKLLELFKVLEKHFPSFSSPEFNKKSIYKIIYGIEKYSDQKLRKLFSGFYKMAEKFLVAISLEENPFEYDKFLLSELDSRKIDNLFLLKYNDTINSLNDSGFHYQTFLNYFFLKWLYTSYHLDRGEQYKVPPVIFERTEQLIFFFLSDLFLSITDIETNEREFNYFHHDNLPGHFIDNINLESIYNYIQQHDYKNKELFSMYYYSFLMKKNFDNESYFFKLKNLVEDNLSRLTIHGKMNFILRLISYCNQKTRLNYNDKFESLKLDLYETYIRYELYKVNGNYFRTDTFFYLFTTYLDNHKISEAANFLEKNIKSINPAHSKNIISLCKSLLLFERGKYIESLSEASMVKSSIMFIKIDLRKLLLKINYELNDYDDNKDALNYFNHFLSLAKSIEEKKKNHLKDFAELYFELIKLKINNSDEMIFKKLNRGIENIIDLKDKEWFKKKIEEII